MGRGKAPVDGGSWVGDGRGGVSIFVNRGKLGQDP